MEILVIEVDQQIYEEYLSSRSVSPAKIWLHRHYETLITYSNNKRTPNEHELFGSLSSKQERAFCFDSNDEVIPVEHELLEFLSYEYKRLK